MTDFFIKMKLQLDLMQPFAVYRKPDDQRLVGYFQNNDHLYFVEDFTESGFVFAPFNGNTIIYFPENESDIQTAGWFTSNLTEKKATYDYNADDKQAFIEMVQNAVESIELRVFEKVVLSRKEDVPVPDFNVLKSFEELLTYYPSAFVYCWYHPKVGMWLGATPEQLVRTEGSKFYSVALAGTQKYSAAKSVVWADKEKHEQKIVTDYIIDNLKNISQELVISSPYTSRAGNILHIKTDLEGSFIAGYAIKDAINSLHPTPAVCGMPRNDALNFILRNENYNREYYSGYLGELNKMVENQLQSDLFVNLRCMKIDNEIARIFVGCGITIDSDAEKEFIETCEKSMTIKKVL